ncbi:MAG TPA: PF20097 family protein [Thermoplasmata archaeon]
MCVNCPQCGRPMESGYLRTESFIDGAKWTTKKTVLGLGGERIKGTNAGGNVYLDGFRCASCRILSLRH